ncbi:PIN domain-containing protein [Devosia nitrariae]|uniref:PIN domain-containing protein n=1 Tax=Devosia nitrariae TaxID=2071872 RepID=UPI0024E0543E|nr:PIN domain-containing protein [Devosia nitrariae]
MYDACVPYPAPLRDILMELAGTGLFRAKWSARIHDEWTRNLLVNRQDLNPEKLARTVELMNDAVPDCLVEGYEDMIEGLVLPDPDDRHVLAAAIHSSCDAIITMNLQDFPTKHVGKYDIEVLHPDDFIFNQFGLDTAAVLNSVQRCRARLRKPPKSAAEFLERLEAQGLPKTVAELRPFESVI